MSTFRFGQPWHGAFSGGGFTLENGTQKTEWPALGSFSGFSSYINFNVPAAPVPTAIETTLGMTWKNDIVLWNLYKSYHPDGGRAIGSKAWLYRTADGTVYRCWFDYDIVLRTCRVTAVKHGKSDAAQIASISSVYGPTSTLYEYQPIVNQSPRGDKAMFNYVRLDTPLTNGVTYQRIGMVYILIEATLSGGSVSAPPSCTLEKICDYQTYSTEIDWNNPENHISPPGVKDELIEARSTHTWYLLSGYDQAGATKILSSRKNTWNYSRKIGGGVGEQYQSTVRSSTDNDLLENGVVVFSAPRKYKSSVGNYMWYGGTQIERIEQLESIDLYPEYDAWNLFNSVVYLSNCIVCVGLSGLGFTPPASYVVGHIRTHFGSVHGELDGVPYGSNYRDNLTVAAFNPRTGSIAYGLGKGFV